MMMEVKSLLLIVSRLILIRDPLEEALSEMSKGDFNYKEVSEISDVTEELYPEGMEMLKVGA
jgi:hypothetical protein